SYRFVRVLRFALCLLGLAALYPWGPPFVGRAEPGSDFARADDREVQAKRVLQAIRQHDPSALRTEVPSELPPRFLAPRDVLSKLDDDRAIDLWQGALDNKNATLRSLAWDRYRSSFSVLSQRTFSPQVVRLGAGRQETARLAASTGAQALVFDEDSGAIAA